MNILHVVDLISQKTAGGSAVVPFELGKAQAKLGHGVTIYASDYGAKDQEAPEGVRLVKFRCWLNLLGGVRIAPGMYFAGYKQFDIVHLHNYRTFVNLIGASKGVPCVLQAHGSCLPIKGVTVPIHNTVWKKGILNRAQRYIADAEMEINQYAVEGADKNKCSVIHVGINLDEYNSIPKRTPNKQKSILYLGRFDKIKGLDLLAYALSLVPDVELTMAGMDYGYEAEFKALIRKLDIESRVKFVGPLYGADKIKTYTDADIFILPSRYEMWGLTFMESLACGTPVIMTDRCQASKILPGYCGQSVPFDQIYLARAIKQMLEENVADKFRDKRRAWVSQYSWENIAKQTIAIYAGVLSRRLGVGRNER